MQRLASSDSSGFWTTIDLLIDRKWKDWNEASEEDDESQLIRITKRKLARKKTSLVEREWKAFVAKDGRDEKLLQFPELCARMQRLQDELLRMAEDAMQQRIVARQANEMERLKKLIVNGKSPLKDCPPELRSHPIFAFWKFIEKEVEKLSRAKADAYYRKIRKSRPKKGANSNRSSQQSTLDSVESCLLPDENSNSLPDEESGQTFHRRDTAERYSPQIEPRSFKYEEEEVKELRELMTVEELYQMADRIIGSPRQPDR